MSNGYYANGKANGYTKEKIVLSQDGLLYDEEAERAVLGSLIIDPDCYGYVVPIVSKDDFYLLIHQWMYEEIITIIENREQPDVMTVVDRMNRRDKSPDSKWDVYVIGVIQAVATSFNAQSYASIVQDYAIRRRMVFAGQMMANHAHNMARPVDESLPEVEQSVMSIRGSRADQGVKNANGLSREWLDRFETLLKEKRDISGLPTGFVDLDRLMRGLKKQFYILAGRPGMGKSALALAILLNVVIKQGKTAMLFSLEMNEEQMMNRAVASLARIDLDSVDNPRNLPPVDVASIYEAIGQISESRLFIDATPGQTPAQIRAKALRKSVEVGGLDLIVIDHLHIMQPDNPNMVDTAAMTSISKRVMTFPKLFGCPVIGLAQLNRSLEQRQDKRPQLSDLRQSGSLEEDAHRVMFLYRDEYYEKELSERRNIAEVCVAKNRDGKPGTVDLFWHGELTAFRNLQRQQIEVK